MNETVEETASSGSSENFWVRAWRGEERLYKVWWWIAPPFYLIQKLYESTSESYIKEHPIAFLCFGVLLVVARFLWYFLVWRCAPNVETQSWTSAVRFMIVLLVLFLVFQLYVVFTMIKDVF